MLKLIQIQPQNWYMGLSKECIEIFLEQFLRHGKTQDQTVPCVQLGESNFGENLSFLGAFFDYVAKQSNEILTYESFLERQDKPCRAPVKDDPSLLLKARKAAQKLPNFVGEKSISEAQKIELALLALFQKERQKYLKSRAERDKIKMFSSDHTGYAKWALTQLPEDVRMFLFSPKPFKIVEAFRHRHTYVSGGTGSGKSEVLKTLVHHYLKNDGRSAVVVIDPHGAFSRQVAQFKENVTNDRLVFLSADLKIGYSPILNPFDMEKGADAETRKEEILNALIAVLGEGAEMTKQMKAVLSPCITTLLHLPNTNLDHLKQFMDDRKNESLKEAASKVLTNPSDIDFMVSDFDSSSYAPTKQSIRTRLHILLTAQSFRNFLVGNSTVDLRKAISDRKIIIFNLPHSGGDDSAALAMGRMILAQLLSIAMERGKENSLEKDSTPIHLFIDEAHSFAVPSMMKILAEARKYKLYLTLANQFIGQFPNSGSCVLRPEIEKNTYIKLTGFQSVARDAIGMANLVGTTPEILSSLSVGKFHVKIGEMPGLSVQNGIGILDDNHSMGSEAWDTVKENQLLQYYQKIPSREEAMENYLYKPIVPSKPKPKRKLN